MAKDVKFNIKINVDGKSAITEASVTTERLADSLGKASSASVGLRDNLLNYNQAVLAVQNVTNAISQLAGTLNSLTDESRNFSGAMRAANTMAGMDNAGFAKLKDQVSELAKTVPMARDELAKGLYQVISNGVPEDNWISYLEASARSAVGGIANLEEVVKVTSTIIKNYGMSWEEAQDIQDKIQLTAKNGVTSFEQLAASLPSVTGQAAQLGVSFTEMLAVMSTLTGVTGNTSEVSTQLASVLTALTKESAESQQMAEQMGISFNAASIKAAGGFRNFLTELDKAATEYAKKSGVLKESIYAKLFGRAEALRLVNGLTGEMADKFEENIQALSESTGTMDAAFENMASTGSSQLQMLKNSFAGLGDFIQNTMGGLLPYLNFGSQLGMSVIGITALSKAIGGLNLRGKAMVAWQGLVMAWNRALQSSFIQTAAAANGLQRSMMALTAAAGIAGVITLLWQAINMLGSSSEGASAGLEALNDAEMQAAQTGQRHRDELDKEISRLKELTAANKESGTEVQKLNNKYGEIFGTYATVAQWQKVLTDNEDVYCRLLEKETALHILKGKVAEQTIRLEQHREAARTLRENRGFLGDIGAFVNGDDGKIDSLLAEEEAKLTSLQNVADNILADTARLRGQIKTNIEGINKDIDGQKTPEYTAASLSGMSNTELKATRDELEKLRDAAAPNSSDYKKYDALYKQAHKLYDERTKIAKTESKKTGSTKNTKQQRTEYEKLGDQIKKLEDLATAPGANVGKYRKEIDVLRSRRKEIEATMRELGRPVEVRSLDDAEKELEYLQTAMKAVEDPQRRAELAAEVTTAQALIEKMELASHMEVSIADIRDLRTLQQEEEYYRRIYELATSDKEREQILKKQKALADLREKMERMAKLPDTTDNLGDIDEAISFYTQRQQHEDADQIQKTQVLIEELQRKKKAMQRGVELPSMLREADEIDALTGRERTVKIKGMGFDELTEKIRELQKMLNDVENPVTDSQRKQIEGLISTYSQWRSEMAVSFDTMKSGWDSIKGIGDSISSITSALEGNGNAWQTVTGIVDGFIQLYEGIQTIVGIIDMLTAANTLMAASETQKAAASTAAVTAQGTEATAAVGNATAAAAEIAANKAATASFMELASAMFFAAHAYIPFVGAGIAAGMIASAVATVIGVGATPFAEGGVVSGPTMALIGEYAGASSNPEVVAPLDKLRSMLQPAAGTGGTVHFEIEGRKLVGVIANETRVSSRSGRRTNIVV